MKVVERYRLFRERVGTPVLFFIFAFLVGGVVAVLDWSIVVKATPVFLNILGQIWWVLVLVFALLFITNYFLTPRAVKGWLGHSSGWKGWLLAVGGGILSSGPIYLWYPLLADLEGHGMRRAFTATFLYNRAVKLALLPLLITYFGLSYTIVLTAYMIIFSILQGVVVERLLGQGVKR